MLMEQQFFFSICHSFSYFKNTSAHLVFDGTVWSRHVRLHKVPGFSPLDENCKDTNMQEMRTNMLLCEHLGQIKADLSENSVLR